LGFPPCPDLNLLTFTLLLFFVVLWGLGGFSPPGKFFWRSPMDNARQTGAVLEAHFQFMQWLFPAISRFPRSHKLLLTDRIQSIALDILESLVEATYTREKKAHLVCANLGIEKMRFLFRRRASVYRHQALRTCGANYRRRRPLSGLGLTALAQHLGNTVGESLDRLDIGLRRPIGLGAVLLPIAQGAERNAVTLSKFSLRETKLHADKSGPAERFHPRKLFLREGLSVGIGQRCRMNLLLGHGVEMRPIETIEAAFSGFLRGSAFFHAVQPLGRILNEI